MREHRPDHVHLRQRTPWWRPVAWVVAGVLLVTGLVVAAWAVLLLSAMNTSWGNK